MVPASPAPSDPTVVARLGLGLAAVGRPAYITRDRDSDLGSERSVDDLERRAHAVLDAAWDEGIRYVDAARSYGRAEMFLGSWLAAHPGRRDELTIGSKWGYRYTGGWRMDAREHEVKEHSRSALDEQWPETLAALGTAPDVYLVHSVTPESPAFTDAALLDGLRRIADTGVRVGFSTSGASQGAVIEAALSLEDSPFSAVQTTWNVLEQSAGDALAQADSRGWLVVVKEVFANGRALDEPAAGRATGAPGAPAHPELAVLGAALSKPWADIVLVGAVTPEQIRLDATARPLDLPDDVLAALAEAPDAYWRTRSDLPWT
ncbi:MAG: aldo/keto reductase [Naasia sp.]